VDGTFGILISYLTLERLKVNSTSEETLSQAYTETPFAKRVSRCLAHNLYVLTQGILIDNSSSMSDIPVRCLVSILSLISVLA
jgi:hypothetical protein